MKYRLVNSIGNNPNGYLNRLNRVNNVQKKNVPQTDRQFQTFIDGALKEQEMIKKSPQAHSIHVSNHAQKRMEQRGIHFDGTDMANLEAAFTKLDTKGAQNSLILYDDLSLIASVKNRTIITASTTAEMTEVTNIDSAIHIKK